MPPTVLIVDHGPDLREIYRTALELAGYEVIEAEDGGAALAAIAINKPAAIVLHVGLPDIDGVTLSRRIQSETLSDVPILAITGWPGRVEEFKDSTAFHEVLIKPVLPEQLLAAVRRWVRSGS
ncbi:MAG: response regulator [Acidobacteria bacterium]|nr:response regulator [Acidobacteriota bacterium]